MEDTKKLTNVEPKSKEKKGKSSKVKGFIFLILLIVIIFLCSVFFDVISNVLLDVASK